MSFGPGSTIGPFKIQSLLGKGGMGEVFSALDTRLDRKVALKILPPDFATDAGRLRRFQSEAKTLASLNHPNILSIFEVGTDNSHPYLVSELLEGRTLREELATGPLPVRKATDYALQIAHGLAAAHGKGVVHRDLKPENIFITKDGRVKILDFGLAKLTENPGSTLHNPQSSVAPTLLASTTPGVILGTPAYMSPEQVRGEPTDHRSDLFSFGCVLHELLAGKRPFNKETAAETMTAILREDPAELCELQPNVSPALNQITRRCLDKSPDRRFQSAVDLAFALGTFSGSSATSTASKAILPRGQRTAVVPRPVLMAALVLAALIGAFLLGRSGHPAPPLAAPPPAWRGERLNGPLVALTPFSSPDGTELAFAAMVDGQSQLGLMIVSSGDWKILTTNRTKGLLADICWSRDGSQIFYARIADGPNGVYRISKYGGEERLVLDQAMFPRPLPDGSLLLARRNSAGRSQFFRYSPETEQMRALNALPELGFISAATLLPRDGSAAIFRGRTTNEPSAPPILWLIDLDSGETRPFLTNVVAEFDLGAKEAAFAVSADGHHFIFDDPAESLHRIFSVDLNSPGDIRPLMQLTATPLSINLDRAGNFYLDQAERPSEILRGGGPGNDHPIERIPVPPTFDNWRVLPLAGRQMLFEGKVRGAARLMVIEPGKEPRPFLESKLECSAPFAWLGPDRVLFTLREGTQQVLASATLNGRDVRRLPPFRWDGLSVAASPDAKTIYYGNSGSIYSMPATGGVPEKLCTGDSVAVAPSGEYLVVQVKGAAGNYLVRFSLADGREERIPTSEKYPLASFYLAANAVARDGRILVGVAPLDSWLWPAAIVNPQSGEMTFATPHQADMYCAGWDVEDRIVSSALFFRSSLWRFRPETKGSP